MIHAYMFVTKNIKDNSAHGPEFQRIMDDINSKEGTQITIYHSFHDEVEFYREHWWKCQKCSRIIKRSMNRAPSKWDYWWNDHVRTCGGEFVKIREPEKPTKPSKESKKKPVDENGKKFLDKFLGKGHVLGKRPTEAKPEIVKEKKQKVFDQVVIEIDDDTTGHLWPIPSPKPEKKEKKKTLDWFGKGAGPIVYTPFSQATSSSKTIEIEEDEKLESEPMFSLEITKEDEKISSDEEEQDDVIEILDTMTKVCPLCNKSIEYSFDFEFKSHVNTCIEADFDVEVLDD